MGEPLQPLPEPARPPVPAAPPTADPIDVFAQPIPPAKPVPPPPTVPAGWYPDPDNESGFRHGGVPSIRYFDGTQWTENRAPMQTVYVGGGTSRGLHLVLTLLTCGLWLPVWIIMIIINGGR